MRGAFGHASSAATRTEPAPLAGERHELPHRLRYVLAWRHEDSFLGERRPATGWMVARLHPTHAVTMVCLFSVSMLLFEFGSTALMRSTQDHPPMRRQIA
jgi:hypothetical protein